MPERAEGLRRAAEARHTAAVTRAEAALKALRRQSKTVNYVQLAKTAGVSRSWLYRQPDIRQKVERMREASPPPEQRGQAAQRASADSLRQKLHTYREELARLRTENTVLEEQLAQRLGEARAASVTKRTF